MVWKLNDDPTYFPAPYEVDFGGILAVGGDLSPQRLLTAYSMGIFPRYDIEKSPEIMWWCPDFRFVIFPEEIHISHSMRQLMRKQTYHVTFNKAFDRVIYQCSRSGGRIHLNGAWLGDDMVEAYSRLHRLGHATSVEVWDAGGHLVGGLYGVSLGRYFVGESMFSLAPSASKLALITLAQKMAPSGGIIDCQFYTPHLKSMGGRYIYYEELMEILKAPAKR